MASVFLIIMALTVITAVYKFVVIVDYAKNNIADNDDGIASVCSQHPTGKIRSLFPCAKCHCVCNGCKCQERYVI